MEEIIIELRSWFRVNGLMDFELFGNKIPKDEHGKYITYTCKEVEEQFKIALDKFKKKPTHNVISRFFQFGISIVASMTVYVLAYNYGQSELAQGFCSGVFFYFMLDQLNSLFRK